MQQANVDAAQVNDVVQGRYHHPPYSSNQSHHGVDQKEEIRQEEKTLSGSTNKTLWLKGGNAVLFMSQRFQFY